MDIVQWSRNWDFVKYVYIKQQLYLYLLFVLFSILYKNLCKIRERLIILICNYFYVRLFSKSVIILEIIYIKQNIKKLMNLYDTFYILLLIQMKKI